MEYIKKTIEYPIYTSRAFQLYFEDMELGVLDIETTGLSPKNSAFVLGGLASPIANSLVAEQYFAKNLSEERDTLLQFWQTAAAKDVLITFNGQHFDIPFIKERLKKYAADSSDIKTADADIEPLPFHLDLFLLVKNFSPVRKFLPNLKQKSIENYMGLWQYRKDEISGAESVDLYYRFLTEKTDEIKDKILLHNHDDIVQLYRLLKVIEKCDLHKALFTMGFPVKSGNTLLVVENISIKDSTLKISGRQNRDPLEYQCYDYNENMCYMHFNKSAREFRIELPLIEQAGLTLVDLLALDMDADALDKYPACQEGFLILRSGEEINYLETNHFVKLFIERMIAQWITNR